MKEFLDIYYTEEKHPMQMLNIYLPECESFPVFIYFHGGGLENGNREAKAYASGLTERGIALVSVEYRMYPDAKYPDYIEDCAAAVAWTFQNIDRYGKSLGIYAGGSSAGGYLSMMLCFDKKYLTAEGLDPLQIKGWFHDAGQPTAHFNALKYSGKDDRRVIVDESAPLYHIGTQEKHSPMRFIISDNDMENRYEQTMLVLSTMKHFGYKDYDHRVMHGTHCHYIAVKDGKDAGLSAMIAEFIQEIQSR